MKRPALLATCTALLITAPGLIAEPIAEDLIGYRKAVMSSIGGHIGAISAMLRRKVDYDHMQTQAQAMDLSISLIGDVFPAASAEAETEALPAIWEQPEEFAAAVTATQEASGEFLKAVSGGDAGDIGKAFGALAQTCKGCHDNFRQAKD